MKLSDPRRRRSDDSEQEFQVSIGYQTQLRFGELSDPSHIAKSSAIVHQWTDDDKRQSHAARPWLNQIITAKRATLKTKATNQRTSSLHFPYYLRNICGMCYFRYQIVQDSSPRSFSPTASLRICYVSPPWLGHIIMVIMDGRAGSGHQISVTFRKVVPSSDFNLVKSGDVELLRAAINSGQLSLTSVDEKGRSILWVSLSKLDQMAMLSGIFPSLCAR